jgi:type I restriction-modification system DNA methylase subunit
VSVDEIITKEYSLSVNTYVFSEDTSEIIDIHVLNQKIKDITEKSELLRKAIDQIVLELEGDVNE